MKWDRDGDTLAAITEKSNFVYLWNSNSQKSSVVDTQPKYLTNRRIIVDLSVVLGIIPLLLPGRNQRRFLRLVHLVEMLFSMIIQQQSKI